MRTQPLDEPLWGLPLIAPNGAVHIFPHLAEGIRAAMNCMTGRPTWLAPR